MSVDPILLSTILQLVLIAWRVYVYVLNTYPKEALTDEASGPKLRKSKRVNYDDDMKPDAQRERHSRSTALLPEAGRCHFARPHRQTTD